MSKKIKDYCYVPKDLIWSKEDWRDFHLTLLKFSQRVIKRHKSREENKAIEANLTQGV